MKPNKNKSLNQPTNQSIYQSSQSTKLLITKPANQPTNQTNQIFNQPNHSITPISGGLAGEVVRGVPAAGAMRSLHRPQAVVRHRQRRHARPRLQLQHHGEGEPRFCFPVGGGGQGDEVLYVMSEGGGGRGAGGGGESARRLTNPFAPH